MPSTDVLVVGAGPTGLLLAGDLASQGVACTVVERRREESNLTRAFAVQARTLELLDARGVAEELVSTGTRVQTLRLVDTIDVDLSALPTRFPYVLITPQYQTERVLEKRAHDLGVEFLRGTEVTGLHQDADGVDVDMRDESGATTTRRAAYIVGTDGVHSTVRTALDLPFPGETAIQSVMLADVRLTDPPPDTLTVGGTSAGISFLVPFGDGWHRVIAWDSGRQLPDDAPVTLDEVREVTRRVHGTDFGMAETRWLSRFHSDERQAPRYRVGRAFLAGDAAHVHSPAGGQGMNAGLQDAANLGWRLAAAVRGHASDDLLDGYEAERHPIGRAILRASGALLRMVMARTLQARAARRMVGVIGRLGMLPKRVPSLVSGIGVSYPRPAHAHHLVGHRASDTTVTMPEGEQVRLYEALRETHFVLVTPPDADTTALDPWRDRVIPVGATQPTDTVTLIRPDGYIAWAADEPDTEALGAALTDWCGPAGS